jgi:hypothetical protein
MHDESERRDVCGAIARMPGAIDDVIRAEIHDGFERARRIQRAAAKCLPLLSPFKLICVRRRRRRRRTKVTIGHGARFSSTSSDRAVRIETSCASVFSRGASVARRIASRNGSVQRSTDDCAGALALAKPDVSTSCRLSRCLSEPLRSTNAEARTPSLWNTVSE